MPVTVKNNTKQVFKGIAEKKVRPFIYGVTAVGAQISMYYAPLEWGPLQASQKMNTGERGPIVWGEVSFSTSYVVWLENNPNWRPRPSSEKAGPGENMNARPHFLTLGFESKEAKAQQLQLMKEMKI